MYGYETLRSGSGFQTSVEGKLLILTEVRYTSGGEHVDRAFRRLGRKLVTVKRRRIRSRFRQDRGM